MAAPNNPASGLLPNARNNAVAQYSTFGGLPTHYSNDSSSLETPEARGIWRLWRRTQNTVQTPLQRQLNWESDGRKPYHEYVHQLVDAGWDNLQALDDYMSEDWEDQDLVISVLDITCEHIQRRLPDIHDEITLQKFLAEEGRDDVKVRLYIAEQRGHLASGVIEAFGSALELDPRFFQWNLFGNKRILSPAERHRVPFTSIGFAVPKAGISAKGELEHFRISIYIKPGDMDDSWTGQSLIIIEALHRLTVRTYIFYRDTSFNSHAKIDLSARALTKPPAFKSQLPPKTSPEPKSFRELYLEGFESIDLKEAATSPFYCIHYLIRLNGYCWSQVISGIREEDEKRRDISSSSVGHIEEIKKTFTVVQRGGSLGWKGSDTLAAAEVKTHLEEDFKHLLDQADLLWKTRDKMARIRQQEAKARENALTYSFTYLFVPISLISSILE